MKTKFLLPTLITLCSTMNVESMQKTEKPIHLSADQFKQLLLTGETNTLNTKEKLNINQNKNILIISEGWTKENENDTKYKESKYIQPMKLIDKTLLCYKNVIGSTKINGVLDLPIRLLKEQQSSFFDEVYTQCYLLKQPLTKSLPYPSYPVVFREASDTKLSLQYLTALFRMTAKNINNAKYETTKDTPKMFNDAWNGFIFNFVKEADKFPKYLETIMKACAEKKIQDANNNPIDFDNDPRKFKQDMEQLFYSMMWVAVRPGILDFETYLNKIYELNKQLTDKFNKYRKQNNTSYDKKRLETIKGALTCLETANKDNFDVKLKTRNFMAKALILDSFTHIDTAQDERITGIANLDTNTNFLCKSYLNEAKFIKHAMEHKHIYHQGDVLPIVPEKSYFVLKDGITEAKFYDSVYDAVITSERSYKINNVRIPNSMKEGIEIDVELSEDVYNSILSNTVSTNGIDRAKSTRIIKLVFRENEGIFELISVYPDMPKVATLNGQETSDEIYTVLGQFFVTDEINKAVNSGELQTFRVLREYAH